MAIQSISLLLLPQGTPVEELAEKLLLPAQEVEWHLDHYRGINERRKQAAHTRKNKQKNNSGNCHHSFNLVQMY